MVHPYINVRLENMEILLNRKYLELYIFLLLDRYWNILTKYGTIVHKQLKKYQTIQIEAARIVTGAIYDFASFITSTFFPSYSFLSNPM
jgi:hypothetical protein